MGVGCWWEHQHFSYLNGETTCTLLNMLMTMHLRQVFDVRDLQEGQRSECHAGNDSETTFDA